MKKVILIIFLFINIVNIAYSKESDIVVYDISFFCDISKNINDDNPILEYLFKNEEDFCEYSDFPDEVLSSYEINNFLSKIDKDKSFSITKKEFNDWSFGKSIKFTFQDLVEFVNIVTCEPLKINIYYKEFDTNICVVNNLKSRLNKYVKDYKGLEYALKRLNGIYVVTDLKNINDIGIPEKHLIDKIKSGTPSTYCNGENAIVIKKNSKTSNRYFYGNLSHEIGHVLDYKGLGANTDGMAESALREYKYSSSLEYKKAYEKDITNLISSKFNINDKSLNKVRGRIKYATGDTIMKDGVSIFATGENFAVICEAILENQFELEKHVKELFPNCYALVKSQLLITQANKPSLLLL